MNRLIFVLLVFLSSPAVSASLDLSGNFVQGGMIQGRTQPGTNITLDGKPVRVSPQGVFVFGFGRDHGPEAVFEAVLPNGKRQRQTLKITKRQYQIQRIDGLPPKMVTPPKKVLERIRRENANIAKVRRRDSAKIWFAQSWIWPAKGRISGVFGSQRVLNGKPRRPHYGLDVAAPVGTTVVAPTDGIVALAEDDLYYTGGTVMLDHGHGITSVYSHLNRVTVKAGQSIKQGEKIGEIGATGRATGAHLDWRINWFKERLDPAFLVGPME